MIEEILRSMLERPWDRGLARYAATAGRGRTWSSRERRGLAYVAGLRTPPAQQLVMKEKRTLLGRNSGNVGQERMFSSLPSRYADRAATLWCRRPDEEENSIRGPSVPSLRKKGLCSAGGAAPRRLVFYTTHTPR